MNIVHIGTGTKEEAHYILDLRRSGHKVFLPGLANREQLVRRIMDADEIHVWDITREFELGMIYFYSVHALHHSLSWTVRLFGDGRGGSDLSRLFREIAGVCLTCGGKKKVRHWYAMDELGWKDCPDCAKAKFGRGPRSEYKPFVPPCEKGTGPCDAERAQVCAGRGGCAKKPNIDIVVDSAKAKFVPPCHSGIGPCNDCGEKVECKRLRAEHAAGENGKAPCSLRSAE